MRGAGFHNLLLAGIDARFGTRLIRNALDTMMRQLAHGRSPEASKQENRGDAKADFEKAEAHVAT
jgi:hypothetical protein